MPLSLISSFRGLALHYEARFQNFRSNSEKKNQICQICHENLVWVHLRFFHDIYIDNFDQDRNIWHSNQILKPQLSHFQCKFIIVSYHIISVNLLITLKYDKRVDTSVTKWFTHTQLSKNKTKQQGQSFVQRHEVFGPVAIEDDAAIETTFCINIVFFCVEICA